MESFWRLFDLSASLCRLFGVFLADWGSLGPLCGPFWRPLGAAEDPRGDLVHFGGTRSKALLWFLFDNFRRYETNGIQNYFDFVYNKTRGLQLRHCKT